MAKQTVKVVKTVTKAKVAKQFGNSVINRCPICGKFMKKKGN